MKITNDMIHPELRRTGSIIRKAFNFNSAKTFRSVQKFMPLARGFMKPRDLQCTETVLATPDNPKLRVCAYHAKNPRPDAVGLLWLHGGGYAIGTPEQDAAFIRGFIRTANCVVVSPDYRLSTQAPYPAAINDCYQALLWVKEHAAELGIRDEKLFVGGDSAGGGLAAAVCLMARDKGEVSIAFQMPFYPMLDERMVTPSSQNNDAPIWNTQANEIAWKLYLGGLYGRGDVPAYAAPARETDYAGLPPAYTFVGDIEPFHDETVRYIENLKAAGVEAKLDVYPGCFHGFDIVCAKSAIARRAAAKYLERFAYAAQHYAASQPLAR